MRTPVTPLPRRGTRGRGPIIWPPDDELRELIGDDSFLEAAYRLGVSKKTLKRHCLDRGILDSYAQIDRELRTKFWLETSAILRSFEREVRDLERERRWPRRLLRWIRRVGR